MRRATGWLMVLAFGLGTLALVAAPAWAERGEEREHRHKEKAHKEEHEKKIRLDQVPERARKTILRKAEGAEIEEVEVETEEGRTVYEAEWEVEGREVEVTVTAEGEVVAWEKEVSLKEVPKAVRRTIRKQAAGAKAREIEVEVETKGGRTVYEAEWHLGDKEVEIKVAPDGKLLGRKVEEADEDEEHEHGEKAERHRERDEEHEGRHHARKKARDDDDDGEEEEREVSLDQVPERVRKAILRAAGDHKIEEVEVETKGGRTVYEAEWRVGDKEVEVKVAPDGKVLGKKVEEEDDDEDDR